METNYKVLEKKAKELLNDDDKMERELQKIEKKLKVVPIAGTSLSYIPLMISLVRMYIKGEYKELPVTSIISIVVALLYFVSPIDIIPDALPGVGYLDDGIVVAGCLALVKTDIIDYKNWREKNGYVYKDLIEYGEIEKEAKSNQKVFNSFFKAGK